MREEFAGDGHAIGQVSRSTRWNPGYAQANVEQSSRIPRLRKRFNGYKKGRRRHEMLLPSYTCPTEAWSRRGEQIKVGQERQNAG